MRTLTSICESPQATIAPPATPPIVTPAASAIASPRICPAAAAEHGLDCQGPAPLRQPGREHQASGCGREQNRERQLEPSEPRQVDRRQTRVPLGPGLGDAPRPPPLVPTSRRLARGNGGLVAATGIDQERADRIGSCPLGYVVGIRDDEAFPGSGGDFADGANVVERDGTKPLAAVVSSRRLSRSPGFSWKSLTVSALTRTASGWRERMAINC